MVTVFLGIPEQLSIQFFLYTWKSFQVKNQQFLPTITCYKQFFNRKQWQEINKIVRVSDILLSE